MLNTRTVSILLAVTVAVTGALIYLQAAEEASGTVILTVEKPDVTPPGEIRGVAMSLPQGHVDVTATIDGADIDGSPDEMMEGDANAFSFAVTAEMSGKTVLVTAIAADGRMVTRYVRVN